MTVQMKATEQYSVPVVLYIMLYKVVLAFKSVGDILKCDHSNESYQALLPVVLFIMLYKVVLTVNEILTCGHSIESRPLSGTVPVYFTLQDGSNLFRDCE